MGFINWSMLLPAPALINGAKSTVLNTLGWMAVLLLSGLVALAAIHAPDWLLVLFAVLFTVDFLTFIGAYVFFAKNNAELLRSEQFSIRKLEIEHRIVGDSSTGPMSAEVIDDALPLGAPPRLIGSNREPPVKRSKKKS
jgi:hypothetical protein